MAKLHLEEIIWQAKGQESRLAVHTCGTSTREMEENQECRVSLRYREFEANQDCMGKKKKTRNEQEQLHSFCDGARYNLH